MRSVLAITGPMGSGKTTLATRLREEHGFSALEGSSCINQRAQLLGRAALVTRDKYEAFFREEQERSGLAWLAEALLAQEECRLAQIGLRSRYDFNRLRSAGGLIIALDCNPETCVARLDPTDPKNPTTREEYLVHLRMQESPDKYGSHLTWVMAHANRRIDTSLPIEDTYAQLDAIVAEVVAC